MAAVKQQVLNWLYSVLTSEYRDVNRTYNDVAQTLGHYPSLSPRTDVYTYENGKSALLLHLSGTIPVVFRGTQYRFPVALWIPHAYPMEPPLVYVTPTEGMMVRPGQHVDPQGKIYHPYLAGWADFRDRSNISDFLAILCNVFAKEPPVIARQQQPPTRPQQSAVPPPVPPPPGRPISQSSSHSVEPGQPPPPPPKPNSISQSYSVAGPSRDSGPPLPHAPSRSSTLRYESAPPLPPQAQQQMPTREPPFSPINGGNFRPPPPGQPYQSPPPIPNNAQPQYSNQQQNRPPPSYVQPPYERPPPIQHQWPQHPAQQAQQAQQPKPKPPSDLLDTPLILSVPSTSSTNIPAPPIPPNPEKDLLLHKLGQALSSQRQYTLQRTTSSLPGLEAQHKAMLATLSNMQAEVQALEGLKTMLDSNTQILHTALRDADAVIESSQHRTAPNVDELLVAPTVVGNQLYELVCEDRSLGDALFVLGRAVERGRISPAVFSKMTRTLAREWYLKKALVKKIGKGMGLNTY